MQPPPLSGRVGVRITTFEASEASYALLRPVAEARLGHARGRSGVPVGEGYAGPKSTRARHPHGRAIRTRAGVRNGLILCKAKNGIVAEYALRDIAKPLGISEFTHLEKLPEQLKGTLPTIEEIEAELTKQPERSAKAQAQDSK
jgi:hypothetical protein